MQPQNDVMTRLEQGAKTARIHRFLPDYLKCTALLRYRFLKELSRDRIKSLDMLQKNVTDDIRPFDVRRIIAECRTQITKEKIFIHKTPELMQGLIAKGREIETSPAMSDYELSVKAAGDVQQRFRQIAYWVEDDYDGGNGELGRETWDAFIKAGHDLETAMNALKKAYDALEQELRRIIGDGSLFDGISCYVLLNEAIHASSGVETREKINVVKIYHNKEQGSLAGSKLGHFSGFLDRQWRRNDYLMGMLDAREVVQGKMGSLFSQQEWEQYCSSREIQENGIAEQYRLTMKDALKEEDMALGNLPATKVISDVNGVLSTFEKLIAKYAGENAIFRIAKQLRVNLFSKIIRFFLWIVKQATAQPSGNEIRDKNKMSSYWTGLKRYFGFTLFGIFIGLLLSFFLPNAVHDLAIFLWTHIKSFVSR